MPTSFPVNKFHFYSDSILEGLPEKDLEKLKSKMVPYKFKKGQTIFSEGTFPSGIFYVKTGKVKKYKTNRDGREQIIYICNSGELFGYPALLSEEPYSDSASALEDSILAFIPKDVFLNVLEQSRALSNKLLKNLSHEFGVLENTIANFAHKSVRERLALSLLIMKEKFRDNQNPGASVEIILSREDLANIIGTAIETLVRLLHTFKNEGLIETEGRKIRILDTKKLISVANFY
jgi:CRP-like cAMP-binding protein